jgi:mannitol/fructose-specific phosphotransferase system IIA component (Ntr-type)
MKKKILFIVATPFFLVAVFLAIWATDSFKQALKELIQFFKDYDLSEI